MGQVIGTVRPVSAASVGGNRELDGGRRRNEPGRWRVATVDGIENIGEQAVDAVAVDAVLGITSRVGQA